MDCGRGDTEATETGLLLGFLICVIHAGRVVSSFGGGTGFLLIEDVWDLTPPVAPVAGSPVAPPLLGPGTIPEGPTAAGGTVPPSPRETGVVIDVSVISVMVIVGKNVVCKRLLLSRRQGDEKCVAVQRWSVPSPANKKGRHLGGYLP